VHVVYTIYIIIISRRRIHVIHRELAIRNGYSLSVSWGVVVPVLYTAWRRKTGMCACFTSVVQLDSFMQTQFVSIIAVNGVHVELVFRCSTWLHCTAMIKASRFQNRQSNCWIYIKKMLLVLLYHSVQTNTRLATAASGAGHGFYSMLFTWLQSIICR